MPRLDPLCPHCGRRLARIQLVPGTLVVPRTCVHCGLHFRVRVHYNPDQPWTPEVHAVGTDRRHTTPHTLAPSTAQ